MCSELSRRRPRPAGRAAAGLQLAMAVVLLLALALTAVACGNKRPPKAPPRFVPATTTDLIVAQRGTELQFTFAYPAVTAAGLTLPDLEAVELWRQTRPMTPPVDEEAEAGEETSEEPETIVDEAIVEEKPPPSSPFLIRRPAATAAVRAEEKVQADPRELLALGTMELRIEGAELEAAIVGDRVVLRLPLGELPSPEVPEEERELEIFGVITVGGPGGLPSEISNVVKILPRTPPTPPSQVDMLPTAEGINIVWRSEDPPVGFRVYRRDAASRAYAEPIARPGPEARSHLDSTASFDSRYVYSVTTVSLEGPLVESGLTGEREVQYEDRYPPAPPSGLIVLAEPGRARLLWEPSEADDLAGYLVYRRGADGAGFARLADEPGVELEYLDSNVASGRGYSYYVSAVDRSGNESEASDSVDVEVP